MRQTGQRRARTLPSFERLLGLGLDCSGGYEETHTACHAETADGTGVLGRGASRLAGRMPGRHDGMPESTSAASDSGGEREWARSRFANGIADTLKRHETLRSRFLQQQVAT